MSKIAFMADLHIGHYSEFDVDGSRLYRCLDALDQVYKLALEKECVAIIDAGDLLDQKNRIDFSTYNPVYEWFAKAYDPKISYPGPQGRPPQFHTLVGNHNMAVQGDWDVNNLVPLRPFINIIDKPALHADRHLSDVHRILLAYIPYHKTMAGWWADYERICKEVENYQDDDRFFPGTPLRKILVAHQEIKGALTGTHRYTASGGVDPKRLPGPFDWCVFGHYHKYQMINDQTFYLGAVLQQEFGEEGNPQGFWIYDISANTWEWCGVESPFFATLEDQEVPDARNYYKLLKTTEPGVVNDNSMSNVRVEPIVVAQDETRLKADTPDTMIEAYITERVPPDRQDAIRQLVKEITC